MIPACDLQWKNQQQISFQELHMSSRPGPKYDLWSEWRNQHAVETQSCPKIWLGHFTGRRTDQTTPPSIHCSSDVSDKDDVSEAAQTSTSPSESQSTLLARFVP
ncbi:hypothetical protein ILYODFUR_026901 [Ilyodon furcidens]|uniref:Uncharacterized protein n=1 Tax=Ilyodon furcidens TaxID=33524 RepID=A0ABV0TEV6_9TELE